MSAATRFESARLSGDSEEARCAVEDMVRDAKDPAVRSSLAAQGAAVALAKELLNAAHAERWCDSFSTDDSFCAQKNNSLVPFAPLARALRNLCAGDCVARGGAARAQAHEALKIALPALVELLLVDDQNQKLTDAIVASLQLACNLIAGGGVAGETSWRKLHPDAFSTVALLKGRAAHMTHPILCATMHARFGKVGQSAFDCDAVDGEISGSANDGNRNADDGASNAFATGKVCGFKACSGIWRPLLRASIAEERGTNMDNTKTGDTKTPNTKTSNTTSSTTEKQEFHAGGGVWLARFVKDSCLFQGDSLPVLCRGLAPNAESVALARDDKLRRKILGMALGDGAGDDATKDAEINESFGVEQATLLELVRRAIGETTETTDPPSLILSEGTLAFVLDLASRAGSFVEAARANDEKDDQSQRDAALVTLRACLGILRAVTERDVKPAVVQTELDVATALSAMGMPRLLLGLLKSLPVPAGCGNTAKAEGPTKAPKLDAKTFKPIRVPKETADGTTTGTNGDDLTTGVPEESTGATSASEDFAADSNSGHDPFPSVRPWDGYRVDCLAPLANAMFGRPRVCDMVWRLGGTSVILACTRGEDGDDYLREWALWGVRNLCAGSDDARYEIEGLQPQVATDAHALAAAGLNVQVDENTGRVVVGNNVKSTDFAPGTTVASMKGITGMTSSASHNTAGMASTTSSTETMPNTAARLLMSAGDRAVTPAGRAVQAAIEAGLGNANPDDDEDVAIPKHWTVADLS